MLGVQSQKVPIAQVWQDLHFFSLSNNVVQPSSRGPFKSSTVSERAFSFPIQGM